MIATTPTITLIGLELRLFKCCQYPLAGFSCETLSPHSQNSTGGFTFKLHFGQFVMISLENIFISNYVMSLG